MSGTKASTDVLLGQGSFGKIYLIDHAQYGLSVIKKIKINPEPDVEQFQLLQQLFNEINILRYLTQYAKTCPWNIQIYNHEVHNDTLIINMEYFMGYDLSTIIGTLDFKRDGFSKWKLICEELISAIHCIHSLKVAHRDIKPANIMFNSNSGSLKLIDFGLSCNFNETPPSHTCVEPKQGTIHYLSPELMTYFEPETDTDAGLLPLTWNVLMAADIWAVANTLYTVAYGRPILQRSSFLVAKYGKSISMKRIIKIMRGIREGIYDTSELMLDSSIVPDAELLALGDYRSAIHRIVELLTHRDVNVRIANFGELWTSFSE